MLSTYYEKNMRYYFLFFLKNCDFIIFWIFLQKIGFGINYIFFEKKN